MPRPPSPAIPIASAPASIDVRTTPQVAQTVLIAVVVNTGAKAALAWFIVGAGWHRRVVAGGLLPAAVIGLVLWLVAWPGDFPR